MLTDDRLLPVLEQFVQSGGSVWIGFRSDLKNKEGQIRRTPSRLAKLAGVEIAEIESLNTPLNYTLEHVQDKGRANAYVWREGLQIVQGSPDYKPAQVVWNYTDKFFGSQGYAAVTRREVAGNMGGEVIYIGTGIDQEALVPLAAESISRQGVHAAGAGATPFLEQMLRKDKAGKLWHVAINHDEEPVETSWPFTGAPLAPFEVRLREALHTSFDNFVPQQVPPHDGRLV